MKGGTDSLGNVSCAWLGLRASRRARGGAGEMRRAVKDIPEGKESKAEVTR